MTFLDRAKVLLVPFVSALFITDSGKLMQISWDRKSRRKGYYPPFDSQGMENRTTEMPSRGMRDQRVSCKRRHWGSYHHEGNDLVGTQDAITWLEGLRQLRNRTYEDQAAIRMSLDLVGEDVTRRSKICLIYVDFFRVYYRVFHRVPHNFILMYNIRYLYREFLMYNNNNR